METRFVAYDRLGARRGVIPNPLEAIVNKAYNDLTTVSLHYDRNSPNHEFLDNEPELGVEVFVNGGWSEIRGGRLRCLTVDFDHLEEVPTRRYEFLHIGEGLKGVIVYLPYGIETNDEGKVNFGDTTAGRVIDTIWSNAVSRGWVGFANTFTATHDSAGNPWDKTFTISFSVETNLLSILNSFVAMGLIDVVWEGRTLHLYNKNYVTTNLSTGVDPLRFAGTGAALGTDAAPERIDQSSLATHVVVIGEDGLRWEFPTGASVAEGRREVVQTYSGVNDLATAQILAAPLILKSQNHLKNTTRQFHLTPETVHLPFIDYDTGNWADVQRGTAFENLQIVALNLQVNANGTQGYVTLGDKIDDLLMIMYQRIQGLTGGVANEGSKPPAPSSRKPSAPTGLVVAASSLIDETGKTYGVANLSWVHNGKDVLGEAVEVKEFQVYYRPVDESVTSWITSITTPETNGTISGLPVYDAYGALLSYDFMVLAKSNKDIVSDWSAVVTQAMVADVVPPPKPTTPQVSVWIRSPYVKWDGKGLSETAVPIDMPNDFSHIVIWEATNAEMIDKVAVGRLGRLTALNVEQRPAGVTRWYALQAYDYTGNASVMSDVASVTPADVVDEQSISDALDAMNADIGANTQATTDAAAAAEQAHTDAVAAKDAADAAQLDADQGVADALAAKQAADAAAADADAAQAAADAAAASGASLVLNGGFETDTVWPTNAAQLYDTVQKRSGLRSMKLIPTSGNVYPTSNWVDSATGRTYRLEYWIKRSGATNVASAVGVVVQAKTTAGGTATIIGYPNPVLSSLGVSDTAFQKVTVDFTVNTADTVQARFAPWVKMANGNTYWVDDFSVTDITDALAAKAAADAAKSVADAAQLDADQALADALAAKNRADQGVADALAAQNAADQAANDAEAARLLAVAAQSTADGKTTVSPNAPTAGDLTGKPANALWTQVVAGKVIGSWYKAASGSTSWTSMPFDPVMIPQINIGTGTFGELDGIRMAANSIKAKHLFIGSYDNLVPNGDGENGTAWDTAGLLPLDTTIVPAGVSVFGSFKAVPTQAGSVSPPDMWPIDRTRHHIVSGWVYAAAANSRYYVQVHWYDRNRASVGTATYAVNNQVMPTVWTKFSAMFAPVDTAGYQTIPSNAVYSMLRIFPNHVNGTATTTQYFSSLTMREMEAGELIVDGSVKAKHVGANEITASKLEVDLALVTRIIAGPKTGTHAEMDSTGFKVYAEDVSDGIPNEVVRMGVAASDDYFAITKANGDPVATISSSGVGSFVEVNANQRLYYKGNELQTLLDARPAGVIAAGFRTSSSSPDAVPGGPFQPYLRLEATLYPGRLYKIWTSPVRVNIDQGNGCTVALGFTTGATLATVANASPFVQGFVQPNSNGGRDSVTLQELFAVLGSSPVQYSILLMFGVQESVGGVGAAGIRADGYHPVRLVIEDVGLNRSSIANGVWLNGTVAPAAAKNTYVTQFGANNSRSYDGAGNFYNYNTGQMYQGLSPAGYGNMRSLATFADMTATLSGATINYIRVYFNFNHWYYNAGGTARIGVHPYTAVPATFGSNGVVVSSGGWPKPGARWVDIPSNLWDGFKSGAYRGVSLEGDGGYGTYGLADRPTIEISYNK